MLAFDFLKSNKEVVGVEYELLEYEHSRLWYNCIKDFIDSNKPLKDNDRVYNFGDAELELTQEIEKCNHTIAKLNSSYNFGIKFIQRDSFQDDVNYIHTYFVDNDRIHKADDTLWSDLNAQLHGIEIIMRRPGNTPMGQVFVRFENQLRYKLPNSAYQHFSIGKTHGYIYAGYPHVGRHVYEMFLAEDDHAEDDHILPMHEIASDSYLWFGRTTKDEKIVNTKNQMKDFFYQKELDIKLGMEFDDPRCAIGWLPVARLKQPIDTNKLLNIEKIIQVRETTS